MKEQYPIKFNSQEHMEIRLESGRRASQVKKIALMFLGLFFLLAGTAVSGGLPYPPGYRFMQVPDPLSPDNPTYPLVARAAPTTGESFRDLRFGTSQTRVSQAPYLLHEYSRYDPYNLNQSLILLSDISTGGCIIYRTQSLPYDQPANLVRVINNLVELRWDRSAPYLIWGLRDFQIIQLNVETGQETVIKDFSQDATIKPLLQANPYIYRITMKDEGEASQDYRFWAFALQNGDDSAHPAESYVMKYLFTWDRVQNQILGTYPMPLAEGQSMDWVGMSPLGQWVIIGGEPEGGGQTGGLVMAAKDFSFFHKLAYATAHADVGLDIQGNEIIVMQNSQTDYVDLIPIDLNSRVVTQVDDYTNNLVQPLVRLYYASSSPLGLNSGLHISCNCPGYAIISTYIEPALPEQNWLDRCLILVRLDRRNPKAFYLAKIYNTTQQYWEETHATIANDGSMVVMVSNWGQSMPEPQPPELFLLQLDMPSQWQNQFVSPHTSPLGSILMLLLNNQ